MRVAIHAGSFDPVTLGHLSVIERATRLFDRVLVVVAVNPNKQPLFSMEERVDMLRQVTARFPNVDCTGTDGYVVELARARGARYLVRGVRSCTDAEAELALATLNHGLAPEIETVFVPAHPEFAGVSSSRLKQLVLEGQDISRYCPGEIAARVLERLAAPTAPELEACDV